MLHIDGKPVEIVCRDGVRLGGHLWPAAHRPVIGNVLINAATGVLARYYHFYARFLAGHGFNVLTYDYRGIGQSRPLELKGCGYRWRDWGELDTDAALIFLHRHAPDQPLLVVGHSIGGVLPGMAKSASMIDRMLTVGAQYAWWRDYAPDDCLRLFLKWHVAMPVLTALFGYFPGRKLGWLEDLPAGVANEWSFRTARLEKSQKPETRAALLQGFAGVTAPILAIALSDDEIGTPRAILRALDYYSGAEKTAVLLTPNDFGFDRIGHFGVFHARHAAGFWLDSLLWLRDGINPWPGKRIEPAAIETEPMPWLNRRHMKYNGLI
ncbi:alpha/beta hydrolase family protein [Pararhizobium sp.]|uniref:alpha/beta hydrolase family protein n=1 Tax=Pararhizobium sp. TaxID=1977563 RepID=UPI002718DC4F|nr:alpha/beta fold hydrolase [Pararhizobium sp.]MDO9414901.1 alpha/beta fold hydrolase [Pararhizobium sp.]